VREGATSTKFWSVRVCGEWNSLPDLLKTQPSVISLKMPCIISEQGAGSHPYHNSPDDSMPG
jgi:hypothetical protein